MSNIKILKNQPKLNAYGQYRFSDIGSNAENLSVSGELNSKFLDDDLYTTSLSSTVNEDIINNDYDIQEEPSLTLTIDIKNKFDERNNTIKFSVGLFDESIITDFVNPYLSDEYLSGGNCFDRVRDENGQYENEIRDCEEKDYYKHYKTLLDNNRIWSRSNYGSQTNFNPGKIIEEEKILENFATAEDNGDYLDDFSGYANENYNLNTSLNISLQDWENINFSEGQNFYVVVYTQGHKRGVLGTDRRKKRIQVFKFDKREFKYYFPDQQYKYDYLDNNTCDFEEASADPQGTNCWLNGGRYFQGNTTEITMVKTSSDTNYEEYTGGRAGVGARVPAFVCKSVTMTIVPPYQMNIEASNVPDYYFDVIKFPKVLQVDNYVNNWYELSPNRIINYSYLGDNFLNGSDVLDFTPISEINTVNNSIDLQQYYVDFNDKFKSSAPGFVELDFDIKTTNLYTNEIEDFDDENVSFAYFVIDWNDNNKKFENWDDVLDDFPTSYGGLYRKQQDNNTYVLSGVTNFATDFAPSGNLRHFYQTSGLKTIKSVVFSYTTSINGLQALRWKLVTSRIYLNENRVTKEDFTELGTLGFTTIPWPQTSPMISGLSILSKYYESVENVLYNNRFADDELLSETKVYNALVKDIDEMGDFIGDVDIEQTRFFSGAYDMDYLLMIEQSTILGPELNPGGSIAEENFSIGPADSEDLIIEDGQATFVSSDNYVHLALNEELEIGETYQLIINVVFNDGGRLTINQQDPYIDLVPNQEVGYIGTYTLIFTPTTVNQLNIYRRTAQNTYNAAITIDFISLRKIIQQENYNPYYNIYDLETNPTGYWGTENNFYPDFDESCVGLIFISDSSNTTLKENCLIELNMGDVEDSDSIVDTSGNSNIGLLIGDYTIKKESTLVPLTRDSEMKLPETENDNRAI